MEQFNRQQLTCNAFHNKANPPLEHSTVDDYRSIGEDNRNQTNQSADASVEQLKTDST
jgi:hypothetical protein